MTDLGLNGDDVEVRHDGENFWVRLFDTVRCGTDLGTVVRETIAIVKEGSAEAPSKRVGSSISQALRFAGE